MQNNQPKPDWQIGLDRLAAQVANLVRTAEQTSKVVAAVSKDIQNTKDLYGGMANANGYIFEDEVANKMKRVRKINGVKLDTVTPDIRPLSGNQYDLVGINGKFIYLMEAKQTLKIADINRLVGRTTAAFKRDHPTHVKGKEIKHAIFYRILNGKTQAEMQTVARTALSKGITLIRVVGTNTLTQIKTLKDLPTPTRHPPKTNPPTP